MNKIMVFTAALIFVLASVSCEKNDDYSPSAKRLLPSNIVKSRENANLSNPEFYISAWQFEYDSENRISKLTYEYSGAPSEMKVHNFSYDGDNITINIDGVIIQTIRHIRKGSVVEIMDGQQPLQWDIPIDNKLRSKSYSYDTKGNVTKCFDETYSYDRENGVFKHVKMPAWYLTERLLCGLARLTLYNNCLECLKNEESGYEFEITYNTDNYPIEIARFPIETLGGGTESYTIDYIEAN